MTFECKGLENRVNDIESSIADITDITDGKLDKTAVVQETGTSTDVVMSQKAVTDAIASVDSTAEKLHEVIKGTSTVTVDLSQDQQTLNVALDKSQEVQYVELTPASATQGTLTDEQWTTLQLNKGNCIILNNEIYRLADNQNVSGLITYVHTGWDGTARKDENISITVSTKAWTLVVASGGGKLYKHSCSVRVSNYTCNLTFFDYQSAPHTIESAFASPRIGYILSATINMKVCFGVIDSFADNGYVQWYLIPYRDAMTGTSVDTYSVISIFGQKITSLTDTVTEI